MTESLITAKAVDGFTTESPIRAFTDFAVAGQYAIGKGFRPSLSHLSRYLDAMESKEGWQLVQVILPRDGDGDPTILFHRKAELMPDIYAELLAVIEQHVTGGTEVARVLRKHPALAAPYGRDQSDYGAPHGVPLLILVLSNFQRRHECSGVYRGGRWNIITHMIDADNYTAHPMRGGPIAWRAGPSDEWTYSAVPLPAASEATSEPVFDDANPRHYNGWECGDIGERLSANGYQILKYVWRLGKKDDPCVEIGKAIRYCEREMELLKMMDAGDGLRVVPNFTGINAEHVGAFLEDRIDGQTEFTKNIARMLWLHNGYNQRKLRAIYEALCEHKFHLDCGRGLAL